MQETMQKGASPTSFEVTVSFLIPNNINLFDFRSTILPRFEQLCTIKIMKFSLLVLNKGAHYAS